MHVHTMGLSEKFVGYRLAGLRLFDPIERNHMYVTILSQSNVGQAQTKCRACACVCVCIYRLIINENYTKTVISDYPRDAIKLRFSLDVSAPRCVNNQGVINIFI